MRVLLQKHFNLVLLGVVVVGLGLGAFIASTKAGSATSAQAASRPTGGQYSGQGQNSGGQQQTGSGQGKAATAQSAQSAGSGGGQAATENGGQGSSRNGGQTGTQAGARPVFGSIASVDAGVLSVTTQQGDVKVKVGDAAIEKTVDGAASDIKAGDRVAVAGQQGSDGVYTATSLRIMPSYAAGQGPMQGNGTRAQNGSGGQNAGAAQDSAGGQNSAGGQGGQPNQRQYQGQGRQNGSGGQGELVGSVSSIDGDTLTLTSRQGDVKVKIGGAKIEKAAAGSADDLKAGVRIVAMGQQGSDGVYSASNIQIVPDQAVAR